MNTENVILQKPNKYNQYIPFYPLIEEERLRFFESILEHLSINIQLSEFEPGFTYWSNQLTTYLSLHGFGFTKGEHLKVLHYYLSVLSIDNLNFTSTKTCLDTLTALLRKEQLIKTDELTIDWRLFHAWSLKIDKNNDKKYGLVHLSDNLQYSLKFCLDACKFYFPPTATQEILDEYRPFLCPTDFSTFVDALRILENFLPVHRTDQGYKLGFDELFHLWEELYNGRVWEEYLFTLFSSMAWNHLGDIDWEPMLAKLFTRFLRNFALPIGEMQLSSNRPSFVLVQYPSKWIIAMIENGNSCLDYLNDLLRAMKTFFYPSNTGSFQPNLVRFIMNLSKFLLERIENSSKTNPRSVLSEQTISNFVDCIKEYAFISLFNKTFSQGAIETCYYLSVLRPDSILPTIINSVFSSIDHLCEPHRFTSIMNCLIRLTKFLVQEKTHVMQLLIFILPGIDLNDLNRMILVLKFYNGVFQLVPCSTDNEPKLSGFIPDFLERIFHLIAILSADVSNDMHKIQKHITDLMYNILRQCDEEIFQIIRKKLFDYLSHAFLSPKVRRLASQIIQKLVRTHPELILKDFLPPICQSIETILRTSNRKNNLYTNSKGDLELAWYLIVFSDMCWTRGDILLQYKSAILSVFEQCIRILNRDIYQALALGINNLLQSLTDIYPLEYQSLSETEMKLDQVKFQFHITSEDEIDFAWEIIEKFLYAELQYLNQTTNLSNEQRLRSLTVIHNIALGCLGIIPFVENENNESYQTKYRIQSAICGAEKRENLRMRLFLDIGQFLDQHLDDLKSIKIALQIYSLISTNCGVTNADVNQLSEEIQSNKTLFKTKKSLKPRFLLVKQVDLQLRKFRLKISRNLTEMDREILLKLFQFSLHRYSEIRSQAQCELFSLLQYFPYSHEILLDRLTNLLNKSPELDHDQIKGCLYILLGNNTVFLPTKSSWNFIEKLWPTLAMVHLGNQLTTQNLMNNLHRKIMSQFSFSTLVEHANPTARIAAETLWAPIAKCERDHEEKIRSYTNLMESLHSLIKRDALTWKQQKIIISFLYLLLQKDVPIPSSCIQTFMDFLLHDHLDIRKYAEQGLLAVCRLQKPVRSFIEKSLPSPTESDWEQICFFDKIHHGYYTWPKTIKCALNQRARYTTETMPEGVAMIYDRLIDKEFVEKYFQLLRCEEPKSNQTRFDLLKSLFRNFGLIFFANFLDQLYPSIRENALEKQKNDHQIASIVITGMIRGSKYWTREMLDEFWKKLTPFLLEVCLNLTTETRDVWTVCFHQCMKNIDPRRMSDLIDFLRTFHLKQKTTTTFDETTRWSFMYTFNAFQWKIPSIWREINEEAKELMDHSLKLIRNSATNVLAISMSYDLALPNGVNKDRVCVNDYMDEICSKVEKTIEICDQLSLVNFTGEELEMNIEACQALNFLDSVIQTLSVFWYFSQQPIKDSILRLIPSLCDMDSLVANNSVLKASLKQIRMKISLSYFHAHYLKLLIEKLEESFEKSSKWQCRRAIINFLQNLIFSNLFSARTFTDQIHQFLRKCLWDEQIEVRLTASTTLRGFYQCGFIQQIPTDLKYFHQISQTPSKTNLVQRHGGVLGLCAIVLSSPYDISEYLPPALMLVCAHSYDHSLIQKSVQQCLSEFRRTHYDGWHEHEKSFNEAQLLKLNDVFVARSYYV